MQYRPYGNTGLMASALGFGAMRLPTLPDDTCDFDAAVPMLRRGLDLGINYIDSAWGYINGTSEVAVGQAIQGYDRSKLILATKIPIHEIDGDTWRAQLEIQLQRLQSPYIDVAHFHDLDLAVFERQGLGKGCLAAARKAQQEGLDSLPGLFVARHARQHQHAHRHRRVQRLPAAVQPVRPPPGRDASPALTRAAWAR